MRYDASVILSARREHGYAREPVTRILPGGALGSFALSGGETEPRNDNVALFVRSEDGGVTWGAASTCFRHGARGVWATELFVAADRVMLFVSTYDAECRYRELNTYVSTTRDDGGTWTEPVSLPSAARGVSVRQGIALSNGWWLFPVYWQEAAFAWDWTGGPRVDQMGMAWPTLCGVMISRDQGESFEIHGRLGADVPLWEPAVVECAPGEIWMAMRAESAGVLYESRSFDYGLTWSEPQVTDIPNPGSKVALAPVGDSIVLLHNPSAMGVRRHEFRTPLSVWASRDGARSWYRKVEITEPGEVRFYPHPLNEAHEELLRFACEDGYTHWLVTVPTSEVV